jgi:AcrR family transcriptional regulator
MVEVRREEIIDAVQRCIVRFGLAETTMAKVAAEAGMQRSAISHFLGNRDAVIGAAIERSCGYYIEVLESIGAENEPADVPLAIVTEVMGRHRVDAAAMVLFDEVLVLAHHDEAARAEVKRAYETLECHVLGGLAARYPESSAKERASVAHALVLLIDNEERFRVLGLSQTTKSDRRALDAAKTLLTSLEPTATS